MKRTIYTILAASSAVLLSNCAATPGGGVAYRQTHATQAAGLGAAGGALLGAIVGHQSDDMAKGALLGAAVGGLGGYAIGNEQDKARYGHGPQPYRGPQQTPHQQPYYGPPK